MTLIKVKNYKVPSLGEMNRLALKKIFVGLTPVEDAVLGEGIEKWSKKVHIHPLVRKELKVIVNSLIENEEGKFNYVKDTCQKFKIDYRKMYPRGL